MSKYSEQIAEQIISVQPMDAAGLAFKQLYDMSKDKKDLITEGYKPVSSLGLMYIKETPSIPDRQTGR